MAEQRNVEESLREGARAVFGVLGALRDVVVDAVDELAQPRARSEAGASDSAEPGPPPPADGPVMVTEAPVAGDLPIYRHPAWEERFPWLIQGVTGAGERRDFDLGQSGTTPVGESLERWRRLRAALDARTLAHSRQVHKAELLHHATAPEGLVISDGYDGHTTDVPEVVVTVSVADCVPVYVVDARERTVALVHAGWRGAAAGILERGVRALRGRGSRLDDLWLHLGPAICGDCYEVGPEVHEALGLPRPDTNTPVDVRAVLAQRAVDVGIAPGQLSVSTHCTRHGGGLFFSHRGGDPGRQMAFLGVRPA